MGACMRPEPVTGQLMSVAEMGRLLGLKKTERYWLIRKNPFETTVFLGKTWIRRDSFEKWYARQVKYHKVDGEEPGKELKKGSYSVREMAQMLAVNESTVYDIIKRDQLETIEADGWMRISRRAFEQWYKGQNRYRTEEDRRMEEEAREQSFGIPEIAGILGLTRGQVYNILKDPRYKETLEIMMIDGKKRVTKESFYCFLDSQEKYRLKVIPDQAQEQVEPSTRLANFRQKKVLEGGSTKYCGNADNLTVQETALLAGVSRVTVNRWIREGHIKAKEIGKASWISRPEFEAWIKEKRQP